MGACDAGWYDCNASDADGCESDAPCVCVLGERATCYDGDPATVGVGACVAGQNVCAADGTWGPCVGQVLPAPETCNGIDDDCNGDNDPPDCDGDGWTPADGDCCEAPGPSCPKPELVNPGAMEIPGNGIDDDCNPATLDGVVPPDCGGNPLDTPTSSLELVKAMDLCEVALANPPMLKDKKWGVLSVQLIQADGASQAPDDVQLGVLAKYGGIVPFQGATMAAISTGVARAEGDRGFVQPQPGPNGEPGGYDAGTSCNPPPAYVAPSAGALPAPVKFSCPACAGPPSCTTVFDSVLLRIEIRVPTNADAFTLRHAFFTSEVPERYCAQVNDRFVGLLTTGALGIPADKTVLVDPLGFVMSVDDALFDVCTPGVIWDPTACAAGPGALAGTGMGGWSGALDGGAGTTWVAGNAPVLPGETMVLELAIWDAVDHERDSLALIDAFSFTPIP